MNSSQGTNDQQQFNSEWLIEYCEMSCGVRVNPSSTQGFWRFGYQKVSWICACIGIWIKSSQLTYPQWNKSTGLYNQSFARIGTNITHDFDYCHYQRLTFKLMWKLVGGCIRSHIKSHAKTVPKRGKADQSLCWMCLLFWSWKVGKDVGYYCNSCSAGHRMGDTAIGTMAVEAIGPAVVVDLVIVEIIFE